MERRTIEGLGARGGRASFRVSNQGTIHFREDAVQLRGVDGSGTVLCTKGSTGVTVGLGLGTHSAAGNRFMSNGTDSLQYELYSDSAGGTVWSNGGAGLVTWPVFGPIGAGAGTPHTVFGRVPAGQDVSVGSYTDVVTATVNF